MRLQLEGIFSCAACKQSLCVSELTFEVAFTADPDGRFPDVEKIETLASVRDVHGGLVSIARGVSELTCLDCRVKKNARSA